MMNRLFSRVVEGLTLHPGPAYAAGDHVGIETELRLTADVGAIAAMLVTDRSKRLGPVDAYIFDAPTLPSSDNAGASWREEDMIHLRAIVHLTDEFLTDREKIVEAIRPGGGLLPVAVVKAAAGTSLYVSMVTRSAHLPFDAPRDVTWVIGLEP